jgi:hypothetical protein
MLGGKRTDLGAEKLALCILHAPERRLPACLFAPAGKGELHAERCLVFAAYGVADSDTHVACTTPPGWCTLH